MQSDPTTVLESLDPANKENFQSILSVLEDHDYQIKELNKQQLTEKQQPTEKQLAKRLFLKMMMRTTLPMQRKLDNSIIRKHQDTSTMSALSELLGLSLSSLKFKQVYSKLKEQSHSFSTRDKNYIAAIVIEKCKRKVKDIGHEFLYAKEFQDISTLITPYLQDVFRISEGCDLPIPIIFDSHILQVLCYISELQTQKCIELLENLEHKLLSKDSYPFVMKLYEFWLKLFSQILMLGKISHDEIICIIETLFQKTELYLWNIEVNNAYYSSLFTIISFYWKKNMDCNKFMKLFSNGLSECSISSVIFVKRALFHLQKYTLYYYFDFEKSKIENTIKNMEESIQDVKESSYIFKFKYIYLELLKKLNTSQKILPENVKQLASTILFPSIYHKITAFIYLGEFYKKFCLEYDLCIEFKKYVYQIGTQIIDELQIDDLKNIVVSYSYHDFYSHYDTVFPLELYSFVVFDYCQYQKEEYETILGMYKSHLTSMGSNYKSSNIAAFVEDELYQIDLYKQETFHKDMD